MFFCDLKRLSNVRSLRVTNDLSTKIYSLTNQFKLRYRNSFSLKVSVHVEIEQTEHWIEMIGFKVNGADKISEAGFRQSGANAFTN